MTKLTSLRRGDRFVLKRSDGVVKHVRVVNIEIVDAKRVIWFIFEKRGEQAENHPAVWLNETKFIEFIVKRLRR